MTDLRTQLVVAGYDEIADRFVEWSSRIEGDQRARWRRELTERLPGDARVLELGCGAGVPDTQPLVERFRVTVVEAGFELVLDEVVAMVEAEPDGESQWQWVLARR